MNIFWFTPATLKKLYGDNFISVPHFGLTHFVELGLVALASFVLLKIYKKLDQKGKQNLLIFINVLMWLDEFTKYGATILTNQWIWNYLPLHLCSINIFVCTIHTITHSDKVKDLLYALCLPGAVIALLISPWFTAPVLNVMHLHSYSIHGLLIIYTILALDSYRPNIKIIPYNTLYLVIIALPIYFINKALDTNFLYINKPEEIIITKLLADVFGQYYVLVFPILIVLVWTILYLPFIKKKNV